MAEHEEQVKFTHWANVKKDELPQLAALYAVPNQAVRTSKVASYMIHEGLKAGIPDMFLAYAASNCHGLYIEFKFGRGLLSPAQAIWRKRLMDNGYGYIVPYSFEDAVRETLLYLVNEYKRPS